MQFMYILERPCCDDKALLRLGISDDKLNLPGERIHSGDNLSDADSRVNAAHLSVNTF